MPINSISDLSQNLRLRLDNATLREGLLTAARELTSGRRADLVAETKGDFGPLGDLERGLKRADSFLNVISEQRVRLEATQGALGSIRQSISGITGPLLLIQDTGDTGLVRNVGRDALARFDAAIGTLNTSVNGLSLFSGTASDRAALAEPDTILDAIETEITASLATTAADVIAVVDAWFAPGGGYGSIAYTGGAGATGGIRISETATLDPFATAEDAAIRDMLSSLSLSALVGRGILDAAPSEQSQLARESGLRLLASDGALVDLQADVGVQENRVSASEAEVRASRETYEIARADLIGVDPFEAATRLQAMEGQLETLYALTARLSRLSLTDYLR
jgi:flagellar hook-associated protein 3 FlgL